MPRPALTAVFGLTVDPFSCSWREVSCAKRVRCERTLSASEDWRAATAHHRCLWRRTLLPHLRVVKADAMWRARESNPDTARRVHAGGEANPPVSGAAGEHCPNLPGEILRQARLRQKAIGA